MRWEDFDWLIEAALAEDGADRDLTTEALIDPQWACDAEVVAGARGVICGLPVAARVAAVFDERIEFRTVCQDGAAVEQGTLVALLRGAAASILATERTMLNFLQRLSGTATLTRRFCEAVEGTGAQILDTRKTTPGWRALEKYAVRCGGGQNHRMGLSDQLLIKDNHLALWAAGGEPGGATGTMGSRSLKAAVEAAREAAGDLAVEVEVESLEQLARVLPGRPDIILLDNATPDQVRQAAQILRRETPEGKRPLLEASGGINLGNVRAYAEAGADRISAGALTHSAPALDITLRVR